MVDWVVSREGGTGLKTWCHFAKLLGSTVSFKKVYLGI